MPNEHFGDRLAVVLKGLTLSNGRLAAELGVDKSLVGRWISGAVRPSAHNLERLTTHLAQRVPRLSLLDWDLPSDKLRVRIEQHGGYPHAFAGFLESEAARAETMEWAARYAGRWRLWRPSTVVGRRLFMREHMLLVPRDDLLDALVVAEGYGCEGVARVHRRQLIMLGAETAFGSTVFMIANGLVNAYDRVITGLISGSAYDHGHTPFALPVVMERVARDSAADDNSWLEAARGLPVIIEEKDVPGAYVALLTRNSAPGVLRVEPPPVCSVTSD